MFTSNPSNESRLAIIFDGISPILNKNPVERGLNAPISGFAKVLQAFKCEWETSPTNLMIKSVQERCTPPTRPPKVPGIGGRIDRFYIKFVCLPLPIRARRRADIPILRIISKIFGDNQPPPSLSKLSSVERSSASLTHCGWETRRIGPTERSGVTKDQSDEGIPPRGPR